MILVGSVAGPARIHAHLEELARLVPADALAAYTVSVPVSSAEPATSNTFEIATVLIDQAFALGFLNSLDDSIRGWLDAIASISTVIEYPHAVVLFGLQVQRDEEESHRVSALQAALVLHTRGNNKSVEKRIQHLLGSYTNQTESTLDERQVGGHGTHRLRDRRLADWVVICWASIGDYFVIALGEESLRNIAKVIDGSAESTWSDSVFREGVGAIAAEEALITLQIRFGEAIKKSPLLGKKLSRMQAALGMADCEEGVWAAGYAGRSLEIRQWLRCGGNGTTALIAAQRFLGQSGDDIVPSGARAFAAIGVEPSVWFERIRAAYLVARSRRNAAESRGYWAQVEQSAGLRFAELFSRLEGPIVVHDFPAHALRLPPAWTIVVPVKGATKDLQRDVDALLTFWQKELEGAAFRLARTPEGFWFMQLGIEGPALTVTDRYLLISFSPHAIRENIEQLRRPSHPGFKYDPNPNQRF